MSSAEFPIAPWTLAAQRMYKIYTDRLVTFYLQPYWYLLFTAKILKHFTRPKFDEPNRSSITVNMQLQVHMQTLYECYSVLSWTVETSCSQRRFLMLLKFQYRIYYRLQKYYKGKMQRIWIQLWNHLVDYSKTLKNILLFLHERKFIESHDG